jgi:hypothetical protein
MPDRIFENISKDRRSFRLAVMQAYFFPYIGYFQLIHAVDRLILYPHVHYIKRGWMNRNRILIKNSGPQYIHVPLSKKTVKGNIDQVRIDGEDGFWKRKLLKIIRFNYSGSDYYDEIYPFLENAISPEIPSLHGFNVHLIKQIAGHLGLKAEISDGLNRTDEVEQRLNSGSKQMVCGSFLEGEPDRKTRRVIEICLLENAGTYINPIGGLELYKRDVFSMNGIRLFFLKKGEMSYRQFDNDFYPDLSIIDVLMHVGRSGAKRFLEDYRLI